LWLDPAVLEMYAGDKWFARHLPEAVVLPRSTASVARLLKFASARRIPVTARGAGFGYVGGCVPQRGGIVLSLELMNRIKEIHAGDFVAVAEAGVILKTLQDAVERQGLYYPPDPASRADCSVGGTVATNAGGPRCLKYGVTRDYVLGLRAVLADGTVVDLGGRTHKNKTGFDLTRLMVGSEGLLGVVTEVTLKLLPLPPFRALLVVGFDSMKAAARAVAAAAPARRFRARLPNAASAKARPLIRPAPPAPRRLPGSAHTASGCGPGASIAVCEMAGFPVRGTGHRACLAPGE
jgi:glycolate oxidase